MANKVLIMKTGYSEILEGRNNSRRVSFGDILRITPLLHVYKEDNLTWLTDSEAYPLLQENPLINRILPYDMTTVLQLQSEEFDTVINLEKIPGICALADKIRARRNRFGFTFNSQTGEAEAYDHAYDILAISSDKILKKTNDKTSQELLFKMVGAKWNKEKYSLGYKPKRNGEYDVALNTYVGPKWPTKVWSKQNWDGLEKNLLKEGFSVTRQDKQDDSVLKNLYLYIDWINSAKILVSSDSLGLHLGIALEKHVFGLFGATPHKEIYFYGKGEAILPKEKPECMPCMEGKCILDKNCIDEITPETIASKIRESLY